MIIIYAVIRLLASLTIVEAAASMPAETESYAAIVSGNLGIPLPPSRYEQGVGSRFGDPGDRWTGGRMACEPHDFVNSTDHVCAHRSYPCGTILVIEYQATKLRSWCRVADRGPFGANVFATHDKRPLKDSTGAAAWYIKIGNQLPPFELCPDGDCVGKWRGIIDMSPVVSKSMGHPGMGYVKVWALKQVVSYHQYLQSKQSVPSM